MVHDSEGLTEAWPGVLVGEGIGEWDGRQSPACRKLPEAPALQSGVEGVVAPHCGTWGLLASCGKQWKVGFLLKRCRETL